MPSYSPTHAPRYKPIQNPYAGRRSTIRFRHPPSRPTPADYQKLVDMHAAGANQYEIAFAIGIGQSTIGRWMEQFGLKPHGRLYRKCPNHPRTRK